MVDLSKLAGPLTVNVARYGELVLGNSTLLPPVKVMASISYKRILNVILSPAEDRIDCKEGETNAPAEVLLMGVSLS